MQKRFHFNIVTVKIRYTWLVVFFFLKAAQHCRILFIIFIPIQSFPVQVSSTDWGTYSQNDPEIQLIPP